MVKGTIIEEKKWFYLNVSSLEASALEASALEASALEVSSLEADCKSAGTPSGIAYLPNA